MIKNNKNFVVFIYLLVISIFVLNNKIIHAYNIGDRAIGMGGAYTAIADDASAIWYNPAGLVHIQGTMLSLSATAYQYKKLTYENFVEFEESQSSKPASYKSKSINVYPSTLAYSLGFGENIKHGLAFAILVADSDESSGSVDFSNNLETMHMTFESSEKYNDYYTGPAYAVGTKNISLGVSSLFRIYDKKYSYNLFEDSNPPGHTSKYISSRSFSENYRHYSWIPTIAAQYKSQTGFSAGLVFSFRSVRLGGKTEVSRVITTAGTESFQGADQHSQEHDNETLDTQLKLPWKLRLGLAYESEKFTVEFTTEVSGPLDEYLDRKELLTGSTEAEHTRYEKELGYDFNLGIEYKITNAYALRTGFFTKFSHYPGFPNVSNIVGNGPAGDHYEDAIGLNIGLGNLDSKFKTSYTISVTRGYGKALGFYTVPPSGTLNVGDPIHEKKVQEVDTKYWKFEIFVSGSFSN